jgi:hypothetical protein
VNGKNGYARSIRVSSLRIGHTNQEVVASIATNPLGRVLGVF